MGEKVLHSTYLLLLLLLLRMPLIGHETLRDLPRLAQRLQVNTQAALQALRIHTCTISKRH